MSVNAISEYPIEPKDRVEDFNGMQLLYVYWPHHLMFCAPFAMLVAPDMTFAAFVSEALEPAVVGHPDAQKADFLNADWRLNEEDFTPNPEATLADNGIDHKSMLTVTTPGLEGIQGSAS